jgi:DNA repair protein SbcD/Mre11
VSVPDPFPRFGARFALRLLHTADWHLGRSLAGASFLEDQAHLLLGQFLDILRDTRPDALLIAGDVFDRAVPPVEAVELLDAILGEAVLGLGIPTVLIPGNHDATERLAFGARLMRQGGLHIANSALGAPIRFHDAHGEVWVLPSGYASPLLLAQLLADDSVACHDSGFAVVCRRLRQSCPAGARMVMLAHAFLADGQESESERLLSVGGAKAVSPARFEGFHYVALGHLHRPQTLAGGRIRYAGSPLAYSFSEAGHAKSVTLVELDAAGGAHAEEIPLTPKRALRRLEGTLEEVLAGDTAQGCEDYLHVRLTDPNPVWDPMTRLREAFPNVLELAFARHEMLDDDAAGPAAAACRAADPLDLLDAFYVEMRRQPLPDAGRAVALEAIAAALAAEA